MKSIFRNLITFGFALFAMVLITTPSYALEITETDMFGNTNTLLEVDSELLNAPNISFFGNPTLPDPNDLTLLVEGLNEVANPEVPFTDYCHMFLLDFGANWQEVVEDDNPNESGYLYITGRYLYAFYGIYDEEYDNVICGGYNAYTGTQCFEANMYSSDEPDNRSLKIHGPYVLISFDPETGKCSLLQSKYDNSVLGSSYTITFEGITASSDEAYPDYYPRVLTYGMKGQDYLQLTSFYLWDDWSQFNWIGYDGPLYTDDNQENSFFEDMVNGNWTADTWYGQLFGQALQGMADFVNMIQNFPSLIESVVSGFPEEIASFFMLLVGIFVVVLIMKIAIMVVK